MKESNVIAVTGALALLATCRAPLDDEIVAGERSDLAVLRRLSTGFEPTYPDGKAQDIVYCVSNSFPSKSTALADIAAATTAWEDVANVRFRYDPTQDSTCFYGNGNVDFAFQPGGNTPFPGCAANKLVWTTGAGGANGGGSGGAPPSGYYSDDTGGLDCTGTRGVLYFNYAGLPLTAPANGVTPAGVLRHELGHILGFRHEHPWAPAQGGCTEAPTIASKDLAGRRLTDYDQSSVMSYPQCGGIPGADMTISALDGEGARAVYGMPASWYVALL